MHENQKLYFAVEMVVFMISGIKKITLFFFLRLKSIFIVCTIIFKIHCKCIDFK